MTASKIKKVSSCLICGYKNIIPYLDLGRTAMANAFVTKRDILAKKKELTAPLVVCYCPQCHLVQLSHIVDRGVLFNQYAYFSSTSPQLLTHFKDYASVLAKRFPNLIRLGVVEIASNDGILLNPLQKAGARVLGVDPAKNVAREANKSGIPTLPAFFSSALARRLKTKQGPAGIILANNVLAHTDSLHDIILGVSELLDSNGVFVSESQYLKDLLKHSEFDNTYHEHICFYSLHPLSTLFDQYGLKIIDVEYVPTQGGSIRVYAAHKKSKHKVSPRVGRMLADEKKSGLTKAQTYLRFAKKPAMVGKILKTLLAKLHAEGREVVGYGAPAKCTTLLHYAKIPRSHIAYIVDAAPSKQGKFTPGMHIPILPLDVLHKDPPDFVLILAWNYAKSIMEREKELRKAGVKFIVPIPYPKTFS